MEAIIKCGDSLWDEAIVDPEADVNEMLSMAFYSMLEEIGVSIPNNAEVVPDVDCLPEDKWQPDDLLHTQVILSTCS